MSKQVALVLGASVGIGAKVAQELAGAKYNIAWAHRGNHPEAAANLEMYLGSGNYEYVGDCGRDPASVSNALNHFRYAMPPRMIKVVVHSLSGASIGSMLEMASSDVERTFNRLAHSFLWWVQGLHRSKMLADNARIFAISSPCPDFYLRGSGVIGPAKAALEAYVKSLAVELGGEGIRVNGIRAGTVLTPALAKVAGASERLVELHKHIVPAGRIQEAEDVAKIITAMTYRDLHWINGAIIDATGGAVLKLMDYAFHGGSK